MTKDEIVADVWQGQDVSDASISGRIRSVGQAVGNDGGRQSVIRTVHGLGFRFVAEAHIVASGHAVSEGVVHPSPDHPGGRPSIAVVPFQPLGIAPELEIMGDAIPHEIIEALSRPLWLEVIALGSSFRLRTVASDLDLVSSALTARYVLTGIIESPDRSIAATLELADTSSRQIIWADRLIAPVDDFADLRARFVAHVVKALDIHVPLNEARLARLSDPASLDAWAQYHIGLGHLYRFTAADTVLANACFELAVKADQHFARAHAGLSFTSFLDAFLRMTPDSAVASRNPRSHAKRALELAALDPFASFIMGRSFWLTDEPEVAADWQVRATTLNPNYTQGFYAGAFTEMLRENASATFRRSRCFAARSAQRAGP